jgi:hypothetical protein
MKRVTVTQRHNGRFYLGLCAEDASVICQAIAIVAVRALRKRNPALTESASRLTGAAVQLEAMLERSGQ